MTDDDRFIVIGTGADAREVKAAELLRDRAERRLGRTLSVIDEDHDPRTPRVVVGTPYTSRLVRSAMEDGTGTLRLEAHLNTEGFATHVGSDGTAFVAALSSHGLINGVGRLLRDSSFAGGRWHMPERDIPSSGPESSLRPIYFATHLGNWYCHASDDDLRRYVEDLALWGYNALVTWFDFHHFRNFEHGASTWNRLATLDAFAREVGMKIGRMAIVNESFEGQAPPELRAVGRLGNTGWDTDLCPSKPDARRIILENRREFLERMLQSTSLDWLCLWPYDQGGCNCEQCLPWPKTYLRLAREIAELTADVLPGGEIHLSAWWIGKHRPEEDEQFFRQLKKRERWFRTIVVGKAELQRWQSSRRRVPDVYQLLLFPEISMFDDRPWGSRGANPAPRKIAGEVAEFGPYIAGAMPYSEGRYEDINKALWAQLMWDPSADVVAIVEDYCRYEFGPHVAKDVANLILAIEEGTRDFSTADWRYAEAVRLEARMEDWSRKGWRWEMVRSRPAIDALRYELEDPEISAHTRDEVRVGLRRAYEHLQHDLHLHDGTRTVRGWLYLPFDLWLTVPIHELCPPTKGMSSNRLLWPE